VKCVTDGEQSSLLLIGNPCPGEPRPSIHAIISTYPHSTLLLGLGIEESEHFGAMDLTG
jgi:hypothetical protein